MTRRRVSISGMLKYLGVSRSGYRAFTRHKPSAAPIKQDIRKIYDKSRQNYGAPKITVELRKSGEMISERTVGKYMREMGIRAQWSKPWIATTKDSDFSKELHNILDEQFNPDRPNAVWCTDITYIWTVDGFVYLTSIMDLFSRKIIAWTLSRSMEVSCVIDAVNKAKARRNTDEPLYSWRGARGISACRSPADRRTLKAHRSARSGCRARWLRPVSFPTPRCRRTARLPCRAGCRGSGYWWLTAPAALLPGRLTADAVRPAPTAPPHSDCPKNVIDNMPQNYTAIE